MGLVTSTKWIRRPGYELKQILNRVLPDKTEDENPKSVQIKHKQSMLISLALAVIMEQTV